MSASRFDCRFELKSAGAPGGLHTEPETTEVCAYCLQAGVQAGTFHIATTLNSYLPAF